MISVADAAFAVAVSLGVSGLMVDGVVSLVPKPKTSDFFEVHSIQVERADSGASLFVDRTIHQPVHMAFTVRIMQSTDAGWAEFCFADAAPFLYQPDAVIAQPATLDWWTHGQCPVLPDGPARIVTTWAPTGRGMQPVSYTVEVKGGLGTK